MRPWTNDTALRGLVEVGVACCAVSPVERLDLPTARQRLAQTLELYAREARECMYVCSQHNHVLRSGCFARRLAKNCGSSPFLLVCALAPGTVMSAHDALGSTLVATWLCVLSVPGSWRPLGFRA